MRRGAFIHFSIPIRYRPSNLPSIMGSSLCETSTAYFRRAGGTSAWSGPYSTPCFFRIKVRVGSTLGPNPSFKKGSSPSIPLSFLGSPSNPASQKQRPSFITDIGSETNIFARRRKNTGSLSRSYESRTRRCVMSSRTLWLNSMKGDSPCIGSASISSNREESSKRSEPSHRLNS